MERVKGSSALQFISADRGVCARVCKCVWEGTFHRFSLFLRKEGERHTLTQQAGGGCAQNPLKSLTQPPLPSALSITPPSIHPSIMLAIHQSQASTAGLQTGKLMSSSDAVVVAVLPEVDGIFTLKRSKKGTEGFSFGGRHILFSLRQEFS